MRKRIGLPIPQEDMGFRGLSARFRRFDRHGPGQFFYRNRSRLDVGYQ